MTYFATGAALSSALSALPTGVVGSYKAFDAFYYAAQYMGSYSGTLTPIEHFVQVGAARGYKPNADFDPVYYQNQYPDLAGLDSADLLFHYVKFGLNEGRPGNSTLGSVNWANYLTAYPDVAAYVNANLASFGGSATNGAIAHYVKFGASQGFVAPGAVTSLPIVLTSSADNLTGTSGADTFTAVLDGTTAANTTLSASDQLNGSAGTDTISITLQGGATANAPAVSATAIEVVSVRNVSAAATIVPAGSFQGATSFINDRSTAVVEFTNIGTADLTIVGNNVATNAATDFTSGAASVTDALVLNLKDGVTAGAINNQTTAGVADANGDWTSVTINSTGGTATATVNANVVGALGLSGGATMQNLTINATSSMTAGAITGWDTTDATAANKGLITITGAGAVNLGALNAAVEDVVASANSGGVTLTASTQTDFTFVGGAGNERITTGAVLGTGGSIDAGAGTGDRLILADSTHVTATVGLKYAGFEELQVANGVTVDMDDLSTGNSIAAIRLSTGGVVNDMTAAQAANVTVTTGGNSPTLAIKNAADVGQIDTVKITANDGTATVQTVALATPVLAGIENLELVATENITITLLTSAAALSSIKVSGAGTVGITSGALAANVNTVVDASAATGALTLDLSLATANPVRVIGGAAADVITTSAQADLVNGGAGIDAITITAGNADVQSDAIASANADDITGFVSGTNDFDYNGALSNGSGAGAGIATTEVASSTTIALALATADAENDIVFIATTDLAGAVETAADACVTGTMTGAEATALEEALVGTGGALNGAIANLDTILGASDAVLFQFSTDTDTFVIRVTNSDRAVTNTLTAAEIELVGVFTATTDLVAADYI